MTHHQKKLVRRTAMAAAMVALMVPVTLSPGQPPAANDACANGGCCRELNSACGSGDDTKLHYYKDITGTCSPAEFEG